MRVANLLVFLVTASSAIPQWGGNWGNHDNNGNNGNGNGDVNRGGFNGGNNGGRGGDNGGRGGNGRDQCQFRQCCQDGVSDASQGCPQDGPSFGGGGGGDCQVGDFRCVCPNGQPSNGQGCNNGGQGGGQGGGDGGHGGGQGGGQGGGDCQRGDRRCVCPDGTPSRGNGCDGHDGHGRHTTTTTEFFTTTTTQYIPPPQTTTTTKYVPTTTTTKYNPPQTTTTQGGSGSIPTTGVTIEGISYGGTGCPPGTVAYSLSTDLTTFTMIFDKFVATSGAGVPTTAHRQNCQINVNLLYPSGFSYSIISVDYRGYAQLPAGVTAVQSANYYFSGETQQVSSHSTFTGPYDADYLTSDTINVASFIWAPCGQVIPGNVNAQVALSGSDAALNQGAQITVDSVDGKVRQQFGVQWKRC